MVRKVSLKKEEKEQLIDRLKHVGLLNDDVYASAYVRDKAYLSKYGKEKIKQGLEEHGIEIETIKKALQEINELDMYEKLQKQS